MGIGGDGDREVHLRLLRAAMKIATPMIATPNTGIRTISQWKMLMLPMRCSLASECVTRAVVQTRRKWRRQAAESRPFWVGVKGLGALPPGEARLGRGRLISAENEIMMGPLSWGQAL